MKMGIVGMQDKREKEAGKRESRLTKFVTEALDLHLQVEYVRVLLSLHCLVLSS